MALSLRKPSFKRLFLLQVRTSRFVWLLTSCLLASAGAGAAHAQAAYAATHLQPFSVFVAGTRINPDFGLHRNYGFTVGADYTRRYRFLNPSIEGRISHAGGENVALRATWEVYAENANMAVSTRMSIYCWDTARSRLPIQAVSI